METWPEILEVGDVDVDLEAREIRRGGALIDIQPRVFDLFQYLLEHRERVVTKTELLKALWTGHSVVPDVLSTAFYSLRRVLRDSAKKPIFIRTVHRIGYQLVAEVKTRSRTQEATTSRASFPALELRHAGFVGRQPQKAVFDDMLTGKSAAQLFFVHGLPGIGKTTLLQELVFRCRRDSLDYVWLSGEAMAPSVDVFVSTLADSLGCERSFDCVRERLGARPLVVFVDDAHLLHGIDEWMRQELWPALPSNVWLVLAGRRPPSARWRCDPAWHRGAQAVELPCFTVEEGRAYFSVRGAPTTNCDAMWSRARGHPLALTLAVEILERNARALDLFDDADTIETLVGWFTDQIDVTVYQRAFETACLFDEVSVPLLATVDDPRTADECIGWLSTLSFTQRAGDVIRIHAVVREATIALLARRDCARLADLLESGQRFLLDELTRAPDEATRLRILHRALGLGRHHPALRDAYVSSDLGPESMVQPAIPSELPHLLDMVKQHEGQASMEIVARWLEHPGTSIWSVRAEGEVPTGFLVTLRLSSRDRLTTDDPVVAALFDFLERTPNGLSDEEMIIHRTVIARADYQAPSVVTRHIHTVMADAMLWHGTHSPRAAHLFTVYGEPDLWEPVALSAGLVRLRSHEIALGNRTFAAFHRSIRGMTAEVWLTELNRRLVTVIRGTLSGAAEQRAIP